MTRFMTRSSRTIDFILSFYGLLFIISITSAIPGLRFRRNEPSASSNQLVPDHPKFSIRLPHSIHLLSFDPNRASQPSSQQHDFQALAFRQKKKHPKGDNPLTPSKSPMVEPPRTTTQATPVASPRANTPSTSPSPIGTSNATPTPKSLVPTPSPSPASADDGSADSNPNSGQDHRDKDVTPSVSPNPPVSSPNPAGQNQSSDNTQPKPNSNNGRGRGKENSPSSSSSPHAPKVILSTTFLCGAGVSAFVIVVAAYLSFKSGLCGGRRRSIVGQPYESLHQDDTSAQQISSNTVTPGEAHETDDAAGWNDGWENDDWEPSDSQSKV